MDDRRCFEGILWILWTGAPWSEPPKRYGSPTACWRRLKAWKGQGVFLNLWRAFLVSSMTGRSSGGMSALRAPALRPRKKGAPKSAKPRWARARSGWFWFMARVLRWEHT